MTARHPGEILKQAREDHRPPVQFSDFVRATKISSSLLSHIESGTRRITAPTALKIAAYFKRTLGASNPMSRARYWMDLQSEYDLAAAEANADAADAA